jgi:hypothetical protein
VWIHADANTYSDTDAYTYSDANTYTYTYTYPDAGSR